MDSKPISQILAEYDKEVREEWHNMLDRVALLTILCATVVFMLCALAYFVKECLT